MRWYSYILIACLFYFLALLQNSFFAQFNLWGAVPNLVFGFFLLLCFFAKKDQLYLVIFYSFVAGLLLDIFLSTIIGVSVLIFLAIGIFLKKFQTLLLESQTRSQFAYFFSVFLVSFIVYSIALDGYFYITGFSINLMDLKFLGELIYTAIAAALMFFIYSRFFAFCFNERQLSLFNKR